MGFFRKLIQVAAPIVGGIVGGPAGAAIGAGISGYMSNQDQAKAQQQAGAAAGQTAQGGANYMQNTIGAGYVPAGIAANNQQAGLLGIGGNPGASQEGYNNYLNSVGYQGQMRAGQQAITGSAAARGLLGSGSTAKALQAHGTQLNAQNFNNYLGQLGGVANRGLQAGTAVGDTMARGASDAAHYQYGSGNAANESRSSGWDQLIGGLGTAYDIWKNRGSGGGGPGAPPDLGGYEPPPGSFGGYGGGPGGQTDWGSAGPGSNFNWAAGQGPRRR